MPLEIERRFLLSDPSCLDADLPVPTRSYLISQVYLSAPEGVTERVRMSLPLHGTGPLSLTHTRKSAPSGAPPGVQEEVEVDVTAEEAGRLLLREDPDCGSIHKIRHVFTWPPVVGRTFELDVFLAHFDGLAILEVELPDLAADVDLPPFLGDLREVTADRRYSNAALARAGRIP